MKNTDQLFLQALAAALKNEKVSWELPLPPEDWQALFQTAQAHHVLPLIYEAVYSCPAAMAAPMQLLLPYKRSTMQMVMLQAARTREALALLQHLQTAGAKPLVVKGMICRSLYPSPDHRGSSDEDILIPPEQFQLCHNAMLAFGMKQAEPGQDIQTTYEITYRKAGSPLYVELHKYLFPPESSAYGNFNDFFKTVHQHSCKVTVLGVQVDSLDATDHLFYLLCHAFKHFVHSGFGLRQVCDIALFANAYGEQIDWLAILRKTKEIRGTMFAAAVFKIAKKYLCFSPEQAHYPPQWKRIAVDEQPMLEDLLQAGIYGSSDKNRQHSSTITLNAVAAQKQGKSAAPSVLKALFPPAETMSTRFPYLKKYPVLLPIAWTERIIQYRKESKEDLHNRATGSLKIGNQRIALLRQYGIIDES